MDTVRINAKDFVIDTRPVVECAALVGEEVARHLRAGAQVIVSVVGVRGVSSSFFNVILSAAAAVLGGSVAADRFRVETETPTQDLIYKRSLGAFAKR